MPLPCLEGFLFFHPKRERPSVDTLGKTPTFSGKEQPGRVMLFWLQMSLYLDGIYRLICEERAANLSINALDPPHNCVHRRYRSYESTHGEFLWASSISAMSNSIRSLGICNNNNTACITEKSSSLLVMCSVRKPNDLFMAEGKYKTRR